MKDIMEPYHTAGNSLSAAGLIAAFTGVLPVILTTLATILAIVWYGIMIHDWIESRRAERAAILIDKAKTAAIVVLATSENHRNING